LGDAAEIEFDPKSEGKMKKYLPVLLVLLLVYGLNVFQDLTSTAPHPANTDAVLEVAYTNRQSNIQVEGRGTVITVLNDDLEGSRHQKFLLRLDSGQTLLVSHNIDLAQRVENLKQGDNVLFFGEYEWNPKGGLIHWTHHDPGGHHVAGWIKHQGRTYQ